MCRSQKFNELSWIKNVKCSQLKWSIWKYKERFIKKNSTFILSDLNYFIKITIKTCYSDLYSFALIFGTL